MPGPEVPEANDQVSDGGDRLPEGQPPAPAETMQEQDVELSGPVEPASSLNIPSWQGLDAPEPATDSSVQTEARAHSERDAARARRSSDFFKRREVERQEEQARKRQALGSSLPSQPVNPRDIPVVDDTDLDLYDPEVHDYHQSRPLRELETVHESPATEASERESKRLKVRQGGEDVNYVAGDDGDMSFAYGPGEQRVLKGPSHRALPPRGASLHD